MPGSRTTRPGRPTVRVRVPATTANLGPGFDALGMAVALYDEIEIRPIASGVRVEVLGEGTGTVPCDERHMVLRALRAACARLGHRPSGIALRCYNRIPHSRGLGSSAAAVVAGVVAGYALAGAEPDDAALDLAARLEGHADNVAACLLGGLIVAWQDGAVYRAVRMEPHPRLAPVFLVPEVRSSTRTTRGLLPDVVPRADAVVNVGRAALAVHALVSEPRLLLAATEDRLHQNYRFESYPATGRVLGDLRARGVPAVVSGAGPTVLALPDGGVLPTDVDTEGFSVCRLEVDRIGAHVEIDAQPDRTADRDGAKRSG